MNTVVAVLVTLAVLTVLEAVTAFVAYKKRHLLIPRVRQLLDVPAFCYFSSLNAVVLDNERKADENFKNYDEQFKKAIETGSEEVIDLGRRIDDVSDRVEVLEKPAKKSRKARR